MLFNFSKNDFHNKITNICNKKIIIIIFVFIKHTFNKHMLIIKFDFVSLNNRCIEQCLINYLML